MKNRTLSLLQARSPVQPEADFTNLSGSRRNEAVDDGRPGSVLLVVLVVVALLALGAYTFSEFMIVESRATAAYGQEVQARALADSGIELASTLLEKRYEQNPNSYYSNPEWFAGVLVQNSTAARGRGRFSVVSAAEYDTTGHAIRFGLSDESAKLNLNALSNWITAKTLTAAQAETILTSLSPDITVEIADAILDWLDTDQTPMQNGAEIDYYQGLTPPYPAKDNLLDSLDELLLVRGMTPQLLFGEDANHNGILDPEENDGAASPPLDNADGILQRGLSAFLTVFSREINQRTDGTPRINVNQSDMQALYDAVLGEFDKDTATFIVAYRMFGPAGGAAGGSNPGGNNSNNNSGSGGGKTSGGGNNSAGNSAGGSSAGGGMNSSSGGKSSGNSTGNNNSASGSKSAGGGSKSGSSSAGGSQNSSPVQGGGKSAAAGAQKAPVLVAGMDVSKGPTYTVKSLYEFFGARTSATINGATSPLSSPWTSKTTDIQGNALHVVDALTLTDNPYIDGRININLAPREVLVGIPNMTVALADGIVGMQVHATAGQSSSNDQSNDRLTTAWLVTSSLTDINTLEQLDPFITSRGDVFHLQSVGFFDGGGPMARVEAVIDATQTPPQVIFMRDLTELGRGFSPALLTTGASSTR